MTEVDNLVAACAATALAAALATAAAATAALATQQNIGVVILAAGAVLAVLAARAILAGGTVLAADGHFFYIHSQHFFPASASKRSCYVTSLNPLLLLEEQHLLNKNALRLQQCR